MRTHKHVRQLKEYYDYDLSNITQKEVEGIVEDLYEALKITGICPPIFDIINRLGFSTYTYPFSKEGMEDVKGMLGVGIEFNVNENSNFFLLEKSDEEWSRRMSAAYLLAHYLIHMNDTKIDNYHFVFRPDDMKNTVETRMALTLLMPKDIFLAQIEYFDVISMVTEQPFTHEEKIENIANTFRVSTKMVEARMRLLKL